MKAWEDFLSLLDKEMGFETVDRWLRPLKIIRFDACNLYLETKDSFHILWFEEHVRSYAEKELRNNNQKPIKIHIKASDQKNKAPQKKKTKTSKSKISNSKEILPFSLKLDEIDPNCTYDNFVEYKGNELIFRLLCDTVGYDPIKKESSLGRASLGTFNPIYISGPVGSGKSHLLHATAHALTQCGLRVIDVRADSFTEHVIKAIRAGEMKIFREIYRESDVLIIDDVHVFSRKGATQEEFFHTFNTLHTAGKQIILSANCPPQQLEAIEERLISRFEWGIVLQLEAFSGDQLKEILEAKANALDFELPYPVKEFLIEKFVSTPKALIRALEALILRHHIQTTSSYKKEIEIDVPFVEVCLRDLIQEEQKAVVTSEKVIQAVAEYYGITTNDILGKSQSRDTVLPRQITMYLCREHLKMSFMKIGSLFSKNHSTVMSSVRLIQGKMDENDPEISGSLIIILKKLQSIPLAVVS